MNRLAIETTESADITALRNEVEAARAAMAKDRRRGRATWPTAKRFEAAAKALAKALAAPPKPQGKHTPAECRSGGCARCNRVRHQHRGRTTTTTERKSK